MSDLTISYQTCRKDCRFVEWWLPSMERQFKIGESVPNIIFVDRFKDERPDLLKDWVDRGWPIQHIEPKPSVWAGRYRLTKDDWFCASSYRNSSLCLTRTPFLAYCDDVSVLAPTWLQAVKEAMDGRYIACGAYQKLRKMVVEDGVLTSFEEFPEGKDHRLEMVEEDVAPCNGNWLFGASLLFPTEDLLQVGGWPEYCDGASSEDTTLGIALRNAGKHLKFVKKMLTYESEELHAYNMIRRDKGEIGTPNSKSHAIVRIAQQSKYFPNYYPGGMRALREHMLNGGEWPTDQVPVHDWYDSQPIAEMK